MPLHTAETLATGHGCSSQRQDQGSTADIGVDNKLCTPCTCAGVAPREETSQQCTKAAAASAGCSDAPCSCKEGKSGGAEAVHCPSRLDAALRMTDRLQVLATVLGLLLAVSLVLLSYQGPALLCYLLNITAVTQQLATARSTDWHPWFSNQQRCWEATEGKRLEIQEYFWQDAIVALAVSTGACVVILMVSRLVCRAKSANNRHSSSSNSNSNSNSSNNQHHSSSSSCVGDSCCMCVWLLLSVVGCASLSVSHGFTLRQQVLVSTFVFGGFACASYWM